MAAAVAVACWDVAATVAVLQTVHILLAKTLGL